MARKEQSLLVVEDELPLQTLISKVLERHGFRVLRAADGHEALALWEREQPDLIMLDLRLPGVDGFEVCRRVREHSIVPIIVMTALDTESAKVTALDLGADDYLTKPFGLDELRARVSAVLRRSRWRERSTHPGVMRVGRLSIDIQEHQLFCDDQEVHLTHTEWVLLEELINHADTTMTHRALLKSVWGDTYGQESKYLRAYIGRLRRKLEDDPARPHYLLTEPGIGYRFASQGPAGTSAGSAFGPRAPRPGNLPAQPITVIGREEEVELACGLLRRVDIRLLTFTGPPGVGKTRLGIQVATALRDEFADGVFFVALAPISHPSLVIGTIARTLAVKETAGPSMIERLKAHLREKQILLLIDNFEQVVAAAPQLSDLLAAAPLLKILVTSRAMLRIYGEHEFAVSPLVLPDSRHSPSLDALAQSPAVTLFTVRARAVKPDFELTQENALAVAAICARLDGLPLAIELATAQVKVLSPQAILSRLDNRLQALTGGARDLPARHQTLRGAIDWSYQLLDAGEQTLFARLSVFVGGCMQNAAEMVCAVRAARGHGVAEPGPDRLAPAHPIAPVLEGLMSLLDKSLLRQVAGADDQPRFVMLETIREYAMERLVERGEAEMLRRRHAAYCLSLAEAAESELRGPWMGAWLERLECEHDNLRAGLQWALDRGDVETALRVATSLWWFWEILCHLGEGRQWLEAALAQGRSGMALPPRLALVRAKALSVAGMLALAQLDHARATALCHESLALFRELGDKTGIALALSNLGRVARYQGDYGRARELFEESLVIRRDLGDKEGIIGSIEGLAEVAAGQGQPARVARLYGAAQAIREAMNAPLPPTERSRYEQALASARAQIDETTWAVAWAEGRAMPLDQAIASALDHTP